MSLAKPPTFRLWPTLAIVAAVWLLLAWPWLSGVVTVPWDSKAHFQPQLNFLARSIHSGESPFWTPHVFAGHPQIADPQSLIFSPPFLLMALATASPGMRELDAAVFLALLAGAFAIVMYFRDRRWHEAAATLAAISFAFGGAAAWRIQHVGQVVSIAYLPIALWLLDRALQRRSIGYGFASGVVAGFMLLGRDQVAFLGILTLAAYAAFKIAERFRKRRIAASAWPLAAGALGGLITVAVPLVMTLLVAADSNRPEITLSEAGKGSLHPWSLLTAVIPHLYGISRPLSDYWGPPSPDWGPVDLYLARNMATFYFGMIPVLCLAMLPLLWRFRARFAGAARPAGHDIDPHRRDGLFLFAAFGVFLLYCLGRYTPFFALVFQTVPGIDRFRRPADALFPACALASMAAGYALNRWLAEPTFRFTPLAKSVGAVVLAAIFIAGGVLAQRTGKLQASAMPMIAAGCFTAAAVLGLVILRRLATRPLAAALVAALLLAADLGWNNAPNESTGLATDTYDVLRLDTANRTIALLKERTAATRGPDRIDRVELAGVEFHWPNATLTHGLHHTLGYNPVRSAVLSKAYGAGDHIALPDQKIFTPLNPSYRSLMTDMMGLRFIVSRLPLEALDPKVRPEDFPLIARTPEAFVYENPRALPRVLFAGRAIRADFARMIADGVWPEGFDPRETVLLERPPTDAEGAVKPGSRSLRIVSYRNTEVVLEASSEAGGFVVLNDSWDDWWRVEVNGVEARIEQANVMFRAVAVPPGKATVRFVYRPFRGALGEVLRRK
ncbi:MAG: glycosyltransferase family 39 protein [Beijerinckiaceae bacterium]